jgi:hypothetical protein
MPLGLNNNTVQISDTGDINANGNISHKSEYKDEYVASDYLFPTGGAPPDLQNVTIGGVVTRMYGFDGGSTTEWMANSFEINHDADIVSLNAETVKLEWHVHFLPSTNDAGVVEWSLEYCYVPLDGAAISQTTKVASKTVAINSELKHLIAMVELPKPASGFNIGDLIIFNIKRIPTGTDTYPADALFIKCALHMPVNSAGSRQRYIK